MTNYGAYVLLIARCNACKRTIIKRYKSLVYVLCYVCLSPLYAQTIHTNTVGEIIQMLSNHGLALVYSTDRVNESREIFTTGYSKEDLISALNVVGLQVDNINQTHFLVATQPINNAINLCVTSNAGFDIASITVVDGQGNDKSYDVSTGGLVLIDGLLNQNVVVYSDNHLPSTLHLSGSVINIELQANKAVEDIIVTGSRHVFPVNIDAASTQSMSGDQMRALPSVGGDSLRVANRLPGISSLGISAKPRIRGGLQDELLIIFDGTELIEPFHLSDFQSPFSTLNDRTVSQLDMYTGGFPVRYGNRISGVMDITTEKHKNQKRKTEIEISTIASQFNMKAYDPDTKVAWLFSARKGILDLLATQGKDRKVKPRFHDMYLRLDYDLSRKTSVSGGLLRSVDNVDLLIGDVSADSVIRTDYLFSRLEHKWHPSLSSVHDFNIASHKRSSVQKDFDAIQPVGSLDYALNHKRYTWRSDFSYRQRHSLSEFGIQFNYANADYDVVADIDRGLLPNVLDEVVSNQYQTFSRFSGFSAAAYFTSKINVSKKWIITPGLRWDRQDYFHDRADEQWSPRVGMMYIASPKWEWRLDLGRFYQPVAINELSISSGFNEIESPQKAWQTIGSVDWQMADTWVLGLDVYRKDYANPKTRFENLFNPFVLSRDVSLDLAQISPEKAFVRGVDIDVSHDINDEAELILRYSFADAKDKINGRWLKRRWSQTHTVNVIGNIKKEDVQLSFALAWHSGWRSSVPPAELASNQTLDLESVLNNHKLPHYFSLDISVSKDWDYHQSTVTLYADIANITDRKNSAGIDYEIVEQNNALIFIPEKEYLLGVIPTVGIRWAF